MKRNTILLAAILLAFALLLSGCNGAHIRLAISASPLYFSQAGDEITFTYTVINVGDSTFDHVSFQNHDASINCTSRVLTRSAETTCTYVYTVGEADVQNGGFMHSNTAIGQYGKCCGSDTTRYSAEIEVLLGPQPALALGIGTNPGYFTVAGEQLRYTFTVRNSGNAEISDPITVEDSLMQVSCPSGPLAPGAQVNCTGTYTATDGDVDAGVIRDTASAVAGTVRSEPVTHEVRFRTMPGLDLTIASDRNYFAFEGDVITFTYTVTNIGNVPLNGPVHIGSNTLDTWNCPPAAVLQVGESLVCTGTYQITASSYGRHLTHTANAWVDYQGGAVLTLPVNLQIAFSPPTPTEPPAPPAVDCSQYTIIDYCEAIPACVWNNPEEICENR